MICEIMMISSRIYLIRAVYNWLFDCNMSVFIAVNAEYEGVEVPSQHVQDGRIVLDISPEAVQDLDLAHEIITFNASFSGKRMQLMVPAMAVEAVYSAENGRGMVFGPEDPLSGELHPDPSPEASTEVHKTESASKKAPHLKVVKFDADSDAD